MYSVSTGQLTPNPPEAKVEVWYNKDTTKPAGRITGDKYTTTLRIKGTTSIGVISCRSREVPLIPNNIRAKATTKCYCSILPKTEDARRASPEWKKACWKYRESNLSALASSATYSNTLK